MSFGVLDGDGQVAQIEGHPFGRISFTGARYAQADIRLLSPILPSKVVCVGKNYAAHVEEMKGLTGDAPKEPLLFLKPSTAVIGPGDAIRIPPGSTNVHHEAELAVVIGARGARNVTPDQVPASIFGYTIGNDVTERDMQKSDGQWTRAKGFDSFCPIGPWIETDLPALGLNPADLAITATVDGELHLVVHVRAARRDADGVAGADDGGGGLQEQQRLRRGVAGDRPHLLDVRGVVLADADHLARQDRRQQADVGLRVTGAGEGDPAEGMALDLGHLAVPVENAEGHALR